MAVLHTPAGGEDNFAFIDRLLDTLQAESEPAAPVESKRQTPREPISPSLNLQSAWDAVGAFDLCEAPLQPRAPRAPPGATAPRETMNHLLNRFCEDGDESIVDELLDNFLGSGGDAGSLIEAIGRGMLGKQPCPPQRAAPKTDLSAPVKFGLGEIEKLRLQDLESPCLNTWDALLLSARDLLLSARTPRSPNSSREAAALPACVQDDAAPAPHGRSQLSSASRSVGSRPEHSGRSTTSGSTEAGRSANERDDQLSMDLNCLEARRGLLSRIADMEDHEAMRSFMRNFLIGMRRRLLTELPCGPEAGDDDNSAAGGARDEVRSSSTQDFDEDDRRSNWSCRSVNTVHVED